MNTPLLTIAEVAEYMGLSEYTIRRWVRSGVLPVTKLGRSVRIRSDELERFIEDNTERAG